MTYFDILCFLNNFFVFFNKNAPCVLEVRAFALRLAPRDTLRLGAPRAFLN